MNWILRILYVMTVQNLETLKNAPYVRSVSFLAGMHHMLKQGRYALNVGNY